MGYDIETVLMDKEPAPKGPIDLTACSFKSLLMLLGHEHADKMSSHALSFTHVWLMNLA